MDDHSPLITLDNISVHFQDHTALKAVSLTLYPRQITTLIGPNGAGKTTLIRVVLGLVTPHQGKVTLRPHIRVGYMPQRLHIDATLPLTVERFLKLGWVKRAADITAIIEEIDISYLLKRPLQKISGGEMQRVLLARALLQSPDVLVLDEPIQGVDVTGQYELYELIADIRQRYNCGIIMASHDLHLVMAATDHVICLNQSVCCSGHPQVVTQDPAYLQLFGNRAAHDLAVYKHQHD